jgi:hypothetical protein
VAIIPETGAGLATANAFVTLAEMQSYFEDRNDLTFLEEEDEDMEAAILYATRDIDQSFDWDGSKQTTTQALGWPRLGAYDKEGQLISSGTIPEVLKEATFERARDHLLVRKVNDAVDPTAELESLTVGPVELNWDRAITPIPRNDYYTNLLKGLYSGGGSSMHVVYRS